MAALDPQLPGFDPIQPPRRRDFIPVDRMVMAQRPDTNLGPNPLMQLASALKTVNPALEKFLGAENQQYSQEQIQAGTEAAVKQALTYKEAVSRGLVPANQSPYFMMGYKEQAGRIQGDQLWQDGMQAYANWSGKNSDNPQDFRSFLQSYVQNVTSGINDRYVLAGMQPKVQQFMAALSEHHASYTANRIYQTMVNGVGTEVSNSIDNEFQAASQQGRPVDMQNIYNAIQAAKQDPKFVGVSGKDLNTSVVEALRDKALETGHADLLDIAFMKNPDGSPGPGSIPSFRAQLDAARNSIWQKAVELDRFQHMQDEWQRSETVRAVTGQQMTNLLENKPLDMNAIESIEKMAPGTGRQLIAFRDYLQKQGEQDGPALLDHYGQFIMGHGTPEQFIDAVHQYGNISADKVMQIIAALAHKDEKGSFANPGVMNIYRNMFSDANDPFGLNKLEGTNKADMAFAFSRGLMQFDQQNPNASMIDQLDNANKLAKGLIGSARSQGTTTAPGKVAATVGDGNNVTAPTAPTQQDIDYLKANATNPKTLQNFQKQFGVNPNDYLAPRINP